jgi:hypothetical protein
MKEPKAAGKGEMSEFLPDASERFEQAVKVVSKAPPQHRTKKRKINRKGRFEKNNQ